MEVDRNSLLPIIFSIIYYSSDKGIESRGPILYSLNNSPKGGGIMPVIDLSTLNKVDRKSLEIYLKIHNCRLAEVNRPVIKIGNTILSI